VGLAVSRLLTIAWLLVVAVSGLTTVCVLLVGILVALVRLDLLVLWRRRVGRVAAVRVVALIVLVLWWGVVALLLVLIVGWCWVRALWRGQWLVYIGVRRRREGVLTCPWGGYGLCDPPYCS